MEPVNVYAIVTPVVLLLTLMEFVYCIVKKNGYYSYQDSLIGMGTAIIAQCINVAVSIAVIASYGFIYNHFALTHIEPTLMAYVLCYIGVDFLFYWFHRAGHRINFLWAAHVPHHSAEELNYAVALRSSFTQRAASFLFYWPLAIIGFSPTLILPIVAINLVYQFLPHTRVIGRFPKWIDAWLNGPYHHQIHHAANPVYWDKNYGGTFIFWDKIFGSYQDRVEEPYYGVTIHPGSWDATYLNLHWYLVLWRDALQATHWIDKVKIWFMPPGWRPRNLPPYEKKPVESAQAQIKYKTQAMEGSSVYLLIQMIFSMAVLLLVIRHDSVLSVLEKVMVTAVLWLNVTFWGAILESKPWARTGELWRIAITFLTLNTIFNIHRVPQLWTYGLIAVTGLSAVWIFFKLRYQSTATSEVGDTVLQDSLG